MVSFQNVDACTTVPQPSLTTTVLTEKTKLEVFSPALNDDYDVNNNKALDDVGDINNNSDYSTLQDIEVCSKFFVEYFLSGNRG